MKKRVLFLSVVFVLLIFLTSCMQDTSSKDPVFRNACWGMTIEEVKESETVPLVYESIDYGAAADTIELKYQDEIFNTYGSIWYNFDREDELYWIFCDLFISNTDYIDNYNSLKESFVSKYGNPDIDKELWSDDSLKNVTEDYSNAVLAGDLSYYCEWFLEETNIKITLTGSDEEINLIVSYRMRGHSMT